MAGKTAGRQGKQWHGRGRGRCRARHTMQAGFLPPPRWQATPSNRRRKSCKSVFSKQESHVLVVRHSLLATKERGHQRLALHESHCRIILSVLRRF